MEKSEKLNDMINNSPFNRHATNQVRLGFWRITKSLSIYCAAIDAERSLSSTLPAIVPAFQRDNDKWSRERQQLFVQNLICGVKTTITLYSVNDSVDHWLLDGLQRMTAIAMFLDNQFPIFDDIWFDDVKAGRFFGMIPLDMLSYDFESHEAACSHYIAINEGITHSPDDIDRARRYLLNI